MKQLTVLIICIALSSTLLAQKPYHSRQKIGIVLGGGKSQIVNFHQLSGSGGFESKGYFLVGLNYLRPLKHWLSLDAGIEFSHHKYTATSAPTPQIRYWDTDASLLTLPVNARINFLKYLFVHGGLLFDFDLSDQKDIDRQTGLGASLGIGGQYNFKSGLSLFINPFIRSHAILPFDSKRGVWHNDMIYEHGVKLGVLYAIGK